MAKPSTGTPLDALAALQAAYDEVLPEAKRELQLADELLDLGIGSIAALEIAASLQVQLGVEIPDSDLFELRTVADFADLLHRKRAPE